MTRQDDRSDTNKKDMASWKPGSEAAEAKNVASPGDFGVPVGSGPSRERQYVSDNTKASDPGVARPRSSEFEGRRTSGAGATHDGDGSGSGGDLDPDVIGVGTGSGIAEAGPSERTGPDDSTGTSDEFASGGHAQGRNQTLVGRHGTAPGFRGSTVSGDLDMTTGADGQTSDNVNNPARGDDSFAGEITSGEAGEDRPVPPTPNV